MNHPATKQTHTDKQRLRSHDIAYACFAFSGGVAFLMGTLHFIPMGPGISGGVGILIGVPLFIAAVAAMITGLVYSVIHYKHRPFAALSITTVLFMLEMISEAGPVAIYNLAPIIYGTITFAFGLTWFLKLRKQYS